MSTERLTNGDSGLEALFAEAREQAAPPLPDTLRARMIADAQLTLPRPPGIWARLWAMLADLGGAPGLAGVGVAGLAGVWIGVAAPGVTADIVTAVWEGVAPSTTLWSSAESAAFSVADSNLLSLLGDEME